METKYKIVLLGQSTVGKSSIMSMLQYNIFYEEMDTTIGSEFIEITIDSIKYQIWDTAGQERYRSLSELYYRNANIVLLLFDLKDLSTIETITYYKDKLTKDLAPDTYKIFIIGNKKDLVNENELITIKNMLYTKYIDIEDDYIMFVSAKKNDNIKELKDMIVSKSKEINMEVIDTRYVVVKPNESSDYTLLTSNSNNSDSDCITKCNKFNKDHFYFNKCGCII
ncbi:MAG: Ras family GTPase [Homavirus sp.]|uniref:Ras family GTPase n=1 Tax=Homavirus sp. TaxID=2487769 RepID=A0A3G5A450_9VIRU|nr:MAG: Ras family GTPase [Homavirus sp.]